MRLNGEGMLSQGPGTEEVAGAVTGNGVRITGTSVLELVPRARPTFGHKSKLAVNVR